MTSRGSAPSCALCGQPATEMTQPSRRTLARGLDPADTSYSVTVILPDMALCAEHTSDVRQGERLVGWCDEPPCRAYGEVGKPSPCGNPYQKLGPGKRP